MRGWPMWRWWHSQDVCLLIWLTFDSVRWFECGLGWLTNNQLIAVSKEELNGQETERTEERLINILLGLHGYMTGGRGKWWSKHSSKRKGTAGAKLLRGSQCVGSATISANLWPAWLKCRQFLVNYTSTLLYSDRLRCENPGYTCANVSVLGGKSEHEEEGTLNKQLRAKYMSDSSMSGTIQGSWAGGRHWKQTVWKKQRGVPANWNWEN